MYRVFAVCASGIGTSLFARKLISESISALGYNINEFSVKCVGVAEAKGMPAELFITGDTLAKAIPPRQGVKIVTVVNMINDKPGMMAALKPILEEAEQEGKIHKK